MDLRDRALPQPVAELAEEATATVRRWLDAAAGISTPVHEVRLDQLLADPDGVEFATGFVDGVLRPHDLRVAGRNLDRLSRALPDTLHWYTEFGAQLAGGFAPLLPTPIVPLARDAFLRSIGHLLLRRDGSELGKQLAELVEPGGIRPVLAPVTAVASGRREADRQVADARELLARPDVSIVSIPLSAVVGRPRLIDIDGAVVRAVELLEPLCELAENDGKSVEFDVHRLEELELTLRVLRSMGHRHPSRRLGIGLPAYLPNEPRAAMASAAWGGERWGGAALVTVWVSTVSALGEEHADALIRGIPTAPVSSRVETDAQFLRILDHLLTPARTASVTVVAATHNLFDAAWVWRLARRRRVERGLQNEFMLGIATSQAAAARRDLGGTRVYTPVVQHGQVALAAPYLVRRLRDLASGDRSGDFLSVAAKIGTEDDSFRREEEIFLAALARAGEAPPSPHRRHEATRVSKADFATEGARAWATAVFERVRDSAAGEALLARAKLNSAADVHALVERAASAGREWGERRGTTRATVLASVAEVLAEWRGLLVEVAVSESGLLIEEADAEVTAAIELARLAAQNARALDRITDAVFRPQHLAVVVTPRSGPIARIAGPVLSALAAGSAVILKPSPETRRSAAVLIETLHAGGVPEGVLAIVDDEGELAHELIAHPKVDRVLLEGSRHTAKLFHSWRAELVLAATAGGRNAIIVTPSADLENAVQQVIASAFDHAGQSATATDVVILVGSVGENSRFLGRLRDAVASVPTGRPGTAQAGVSALARAASGRVLEALEVLEAGESWLVRPRRLDGAGRLWSPGLRDGVQHRSPFRSRENRAPVLGIMRAATLEEAIELQNWPGFGLAAGIQSLDAAELEEWTAGVQAGMLFANCPVIPEAGALVPFAGWNRSRIGTGAPLGGHDDLITLGTWHPAPLEPPSTVTLDGIAEPVARLIDAALPSMDFEEFGRVRAAALSDAEAWRRIAGVHELAGIEVERTLQRYRSIPVTIRVAEGAGQADLVRVLAAATLTGGAVAISTAFPLHAQLIDLFGAPGSPVAVAEVLVESDARWHARVQTADVGTTRIRLIGGDRLVLARVLHGKPGIAVYADPVTASGTVELLPFLVEQSIRMSAVRFGRPDPSMLGVSFA